jgi:hypothetical protein
MWETDTIVAIPESVLPDKNILYISLIDGGAWNADGKGGIGKLSFNGKQYNSTWITGADYAMYNANEKKKLKPVGEWNTSKIIFNNGHVEHWLNGEKIVEFEAWSDEWKTKKSEGKWKDFPDYGSAKKGGIALQDHGNKAWFKNITIREL